MRDLPDSLSAAPDHSPEETERNRRPGPSPYLMALTTAYFLAPNWKAESALNEIIADECKAQGIDHLDLLDHPEFEGLEAEGG